MDRECFTATGKRKWPHDTPHVPHWYSRTTRRSRFDASFATARAFARTEDNTYGPRPVVSRYRRYARIRGVSPGCRNRSTMRAIS